MKTKLCTICKKEKNIDLFYKKEYGKFGRDSRCIECIKAYRKKNKDLFDIYRKEYYKTHKEERKKYLDNYREKNKERLKTYSEHYKKTHKKEISDYGKYYYKINKESYKVWAKNYYQRNKHKRNEYLRKVRKNSPKFRLNQSMSKAIGRILKNGKGGKSWLNFVDFNISSLMEHIGKQFTEGMSWDNYGEWHIDHKIPIGAFNFTKPEHADFKRCWALKNLQPLWAIENMSKGAKLTKPFQPSLLI